MFTLASAEKLTTPPPEKEALKPDYLGFGKPQGIKVACTGNPNNFRDCHIGWFVQNSRYSRPIDYLEPGKKYWGRPTKTWTSTVFVDGDAVLTNHKRQKTLLVLQQCDYKGNDITGVDLLIGTVYVKSGETVTIYPLKQYRKVFYNKGRLTIRKRGFEHPDEVERQRNEVRRWG